ncbi:MAG: NAD(P)-binding domain-containing protein [Bacteroidetes bacterium]|jgi:trk system potassium uptake protein TrkA|nr:NAD(P)-binding domain-containing protein [Bacteroidota bacterium]
MKYIIIGLGNFGASLAQKLTRTGNEVIGVDSQMAKVELFKEKISHTICLDATDEQAVTHLPLRDTDVVMVCIGEDEGANILATALMKQKKAKRLISRAVSPLHETVLQAMHVDEIIHPEEETAERWAKKLNMHGVLDSYELTGDYCIVEAKVPERYDGKTLEEAGLNKKYGVIVLTLIAIQEEDNELGLKVPTPKTKGVANAQTELTADDIMVLYGKSEDIRKLLE